MIASKKAIIKKSSIFFVFLLLFSFCLTAHAASYTLYASVGANDSVCNNLLGFYHNKTDYNPFNEFVICRTGQSEYYLFYSDSLSTGSYNYIRYYGTNSGSYNTIWNYQEGTGSNLSINYNNFVAVGNVNQSIASSTAETFKFQYILILVAILVLIILMFKFFRVSLHARSEQSKGGWDV